MAGRGRAVETTNYRDNDFFEMRREHQQREAEWDKSDKLAADGQCVRRRAITVLFDRRWMSAGTTEGGAMSSARKWSFCWI